LNGTQGVTGAVYMAPMRDATVGLTGATGQAGKGFPDYMMAYDPTQDPVYNQSSNGTYEITWGRHSMLLATFYLPSIPSSGGPGWDLTSVNAITSGIIVNPFGNEPLVAGTSLLCQTNKYIYYLVTCGPSLTPILNGGSPILDTGITCQTWLPGGVPLGVACDGIYAVLFDPNGAYNEAANLYIHMGDSNSPKSVWANVSWSSSIEWLQDPRSVISITAIIPPAGTATTFNARIMLLGGNHSF
jgi:hypothetical protein